MNTNKIEVLLIPTTEPTNITKRTKTNSLMYSYKDFSGLNPKINENQYMYFLSDDEIQEGDCMYDIDGDVGFAIGNDKFQWGGNKKIVGTTDPELTTNGVPSIHPNFQKLYCLTNGTQNHLTIETIDNIIHQPFDKERIDEVFLRLTKTLPKNHKAFIGAFIQDFHVRLKLLPLDIFYVEMFKNTYRSLIDNLSEDDYGHIKSYLQNYTHAKINKKMFS